MSDPSPTEFVRPRPRHDATITLVESDPRWPAQYAACAEAIRRALGDRVVTLEHTGSTSVPGLSAKPVIDVLLLVTDPADEASYVPDLEAAGFLLHVRESGWHQHRLLRGVDPAVNLHVFGIGSPEAERMLLFRDHLRADPDDLALYESTKRELASRTWAVVQDYADAKSAVVEAIIARAGAKRAQ
jgi:GrpB-like predicted nucleotidyltransferase (UPF0157 family)